jgi:plastocyanin
MQAVLKGLAVVAIGILSPTSLAAQETHVVRLVANADKDEYRFEPAELIVHPNDVVVFRVASGPPHSIVFEGGELSQDVRGAFNAVMPGRSAELSSPLLTTPGAEYRMVIPQVPPGTYNFFCLPHRAYDMRGTLRVK